MHLRHHTTASNELLSPIHDRMPVIVPPSGRALWLGAEAVRKEALLGFLAPYPAREMEAYEVSASVNRPGNKSPENIDPVSAF